MPYLHVRGPHQTALGSRELQEARKKVMALNLLMGADLATVAEHFRVARSTVSIAIREAGLITALIYVQGPVNGNPRKEDGC